MSVNLLVSPQTQYNESRKKLQKLRQMLALNREAQAKLANLRGHIEIRRRELEEIGLLHAYRKDTVNPMFDPSRAVEEVRRIPAILQDQLLIKKNSAQEYGFIKNLMSEERQPKKNKVKISKSQQMTLVNFFADVRKIDFVAQGQKFGKSGIQYYKQLKMLAKKEQQLKLTYEIDENRLKQKRKIYGDNWEKICYFFNGYTFQNLYYYFQKNNLNNVEQGKWTKRQNLMLIALAEYYGQGKWALISKKLKVKSEFQIRQRFCNVLDPKIKQNKWTEQQERLLLHEAPLKRYKWSKIVKEIPQFSKKTDNALRRKFRNLMIKKQDHEIQELIKNKILQKSILEFKKSYYNRKKRTGEGNSLSKAEQEMS